MQELGPKKTKTLSKRARQSKPCSVVAARAAAALGAKRSMGTRRMGAAMTVDAGVVEGARAGQEKRL